MGELNLSNHVDMKMRAVNDIIKQIQSEYHWIKDNVKNASISIEMFMEISMFQMDQIDLILFLLAKLKILHDLKRAHIIEAIENDERRTRGMTFLLDLFF